MVKVAQAWREEAELFGVAKLARAMRASRGRSPAPILLPLGPSLPKKKAGINNHGFIATVSSSEEACVFNATPAASTCTTIDTPIGRIGSSQDDAVVEFEKMSRIPELNCTAFSTPICRRG